MKQLVVRVSIVVAVSVSTAQPAMAANGSEASAIVVTHGSRSAPGVEAGASGYWDPSPGGSSRSSAASRDSESISRSSAPPVRLLPTSCLGSSANAGDFIVSMNKNSCVAAAARPPSAPDPGVPLPSPIELAWIAADRAASFAEWPELRVAPSRIGLTGLRSYFWLARHPRPVTAGASVPGMTVTAYAEPVEFRWDFGEGGGRSTSHSGRAWTRRRPGNIAHMYETRGSRTIAVEVIWQARWRINGGAWQHLGYFSNGDERTYPVRQMVAMLGRTRRR